MTVLICQILAKNQFCDIAITDYSIYFRLLVKQMNTMILKILSQFFLHQSANKYTIEILSNFLLEVMNFTWDSMKILQCPLI